MVFRTSHNHFSDSPMISLFSNYSSVGAAVGYSFGVAAGYGKGIVGPRTTYMTYQKVFSWIYAGCFV